MQRRSRLPAGARDGVARRLAARVQQPRRRQRRTSTASCAASRRFPASTPSASATSCRSGATAPGAYAPRASSISRDRRRRSSRASSTSTTCRRCRFRCAPAGSSTPATRAASEKVVIINESLARRLWPDRDAVGQIVTQGRRHHRDRRRRQRPARLARGSRRQRDVSRTTGRPATGRGWKWSCAAPGRPQSLVPEVRTALAAYDPSLPNGEFYELERLVDNAVAPRRLTTRHARRVFRSGACARGDRPLRRHRLFGRAAHAGDRHPDGDWRRGVAMSSSSSSLVASASSRSVSSSASLPRFS